MTFLVSALSLIDFKDTVFSFGTFRNRESRVGPLQISHLQYSQLGHRIFETFVLATPTTMMCHYSHSVELLTYLGKAVRASCGGHSLEDQPWQRSQRT